VRVPVPDETQELSSQRPALRGRLDVSGKGEFSAPTDWSTLAQGGANDVSPPLFSHPLLVVLSASVIIPCNTVTHRPHTCLWRLQAAFGLLFFALASVSAAADAKRVLVVHSFVNAAPPFTTHSTAFEATLTAEMGKKIDLDEVSLDVARYTTLDMEEALVEFMRKRQEKWRPDLVVPIGSPAGVFVARHRDRLFPTTPVLYTGMDRRRLPPDALERNAAFVGESFDFPEMVEEILRLAPATTNIAVVIGASQLEQYWASAIRREWMPFTNRVSFTWLNELSYDQMLGRLSTLQPRSFIFLILLMRDAAGVTHNADETLRQIHDVANAPVNSIFRHQLGLGIVGGRLYQAELEGVESARIAVRILRGEPATNFPPRIVGPLEPSYDERELKRWNISESRLPPGSTVLFRVPTVWGRYRPWIIAGISVCLLEALLIFLLVANLVKRRRAERSLVESENRFRIAADATPVMIWMSGVDKLCTFINKPWLELTGRTPDQDIGNGWTEGVHPDDLQKCLKTYAEAFDARQQFVMEYRLRRHDGEYRWISDTGGPRHDNQGNFAGYIGTCLDITQQKQAEQTAREFSGRLLHAQEAERARLARELHDDITQRLALLAIEAGRVERAGAGGAIGDTMRGVREGLVRLSEDVHALSYRLHSSLLEDLGLAEALKVECEQFARQESIPCNVKLQNLPEAVPRDAALGLFRVTQEALRNVARHAQAQTVGVTLRSLDAGLQLAVHDDGIGFDAAHKPNRTSLGLSSMSERMRLLDGELDIESLPGHGTTVVAWVPLKGKEA